MRKPSNTPRLPSSHKASTGLRQAGAAEVLPMDEVWRAVFAPPDRREIFEWGGEHVELPPGLTRSGKFSVQGSRRLIAPFRALRALQVREVNLLASVRGAKTIIADVFAPWAVVNDHASILWLMQKDSVAKEHAETRQWPILEQCEPIVPLLPASRHKQRTREIIFANGLPLMMRGPSLANLQSRGYKVAICDEAWMYETGVLGQVKARLGDYKKIEASKLFVPSQGGAPRSDWHLQYESGVIHEWFVPCQAVHCGKFFQPVWTGVHEDRRRHGMVFDLEKRADGTYDKARAQATVRYVCPHCGHEHPDTAATRLAWDVGGDYFAAAGGPPSHEATARSGPAGFAPAGPRVDEHYVFPEVCSFRYWAVLDWPWRELVSLWVDARTAAHFGDYTATIIFCQKYLAEMKDESNVHESNQSFVRKKSDAPEQAPRERSFPGAAIRIITADRQAEDTYWVQIRDWAENGESLRVFYGRLFSDADIRAQQEKFGSGAFDPKVDIDPDSCVWVDSGYRPRGDQGVYMSCIRWGWIAARGDPKAEFAHYIPDPADRDGKRLLKVMRPFSPVANADPFEGDTEGRQGRQFAPLVYFSSSVMKDRVDGLIKKGLWMEPPDEDAESGRQYRVQMAAEFKKRVWVAAKQRFEEVWVCPSGNNHAMDTSAMQVLCAMQVGLLPSGI